jgi:hypothetical protein
MRRCFGRTIVAAVLLALIVPSLAAQEPAARRPPSPVRLTLGVELEGVLSIQKEITVKVRTTQANDFGFRVETEEIWVLDLGGDMNLLKEAKQLDGKRVTVAGSCLLRGVATRTFKSKTGFPERLVETMSSRSVLDVERRVRVQRLEPAKGE